MVTRLDRLARSTRDLLQHHRHGGEGRRQLPLAWRSMGRHHHGARPLDPHGLRRPCGVRARADPRAHRRRPHTGQGERRGSVSTSSGEPSQRVKCSIIRAAKVARFRNTARPITKRNLRCSCSQFSRLACASGAALAPLPGSHRTDKPAYGGRVVAGGFARHQEIGADGADPAIGGPFAGHLTVEAAMDTLAAPPMEPAVSRRKICAAGWRA